MRFLEKPLNQISDTSVSIDWIYKECIFLSTGLLDHLQNSTDHFYEVNSVKKIKIISCDFEFHIGVTRALAWNFENIEIHIVIQTLTCAVVSTLGTLDLSVIIVLWNYYLLL